MSSGLLTQIFYAVSLLTNAVFIIVAVYVLWRMEGATARAVFDIKKTSDQMTHTLHSLQQWGSGFQGWSKNFIHTAQGALKPAQDEQAQASQIALDDQLQKVTDTIESLDLKRLTRLVNELDLMIRAMGDEPSISGKAPKDEAAAVPAKGPSAALRKEIEHLQTRLADATKMAYDLRRENRAAFTSTSALEALRQTNERLFAELKHRRERMGHMDERLERIQDLLRHLTTQPAELPRPAAGVGPEQLAALEELQARLEAVEQERGQLNEQLQEIEDALGRTLREKEMIEDRFLALAQA